MVFCFFGTIGFLSCWICSAKVSPSLANSEIVRMALSGCLLGCMGLLEWGERGFMGRVGSNQRPMGRPMVFRWGL